MDKELLSVMNKMIDERSEVLGRKITKEQAGSIIMELDAMINHKINKLASGSLMDCGSFGCPNSYHCDWF